MTPVALNLHIARGITFGPILITCQDAASHVVDLTGWTAFAQVRPTPTQPLTIDLQPTISNPTGGQITINLTAAQTAALPIGSFRWDLILQRPTGERLGPLITGDVTIASTITQPAAFLLIATGASQSGPATRRTFLRRLLGVAAAIPLLTLGGGCADITPQPVSELTIEIESGFPCQGPWL